jgi:hypothetical protein
MRGKVVLCKNVFLLFSLKSLHWAEEEEEEGHER